MRRIKSILDEKGISIRYFNDDSFRITVGSALENDLVVSTIKKVLLKNLLSWYEKIAWFFIELLALWKLYKFKSFIAWLIRLQ